MKTLILNGGPHKNGRTATVLSAVREGLSGKGQVEWLDVYDLNMRPCIGCMKCRPNMVCVLPIDDAQSFRRKMEAADAIVVGTPTYWGNMTAPLKALFDRNVTLFETFEKGFPSPRLKGKVAAIVVSTGASWPFSLLPTMGGGAVKSLKTILQAGGLRIVGRVIVAGAGKRGATNEQLRIWGFRIADRLRKLSSNPQLT